MNVVVDRHSEVGRFVPHGIIRSGIEDRINYMLLQGPFNKEALQTFAMKHAEQVHGLARNGAYVQLTVFLENMEMPMEAFDLVAQSMMNNDVNENATSAVAFVAANDVVGREILMPRFQKTYEKHGRNFRSFESEDMARAWLATVLNSKQ